MKLLASTPGTRLGSIGALGTAITWTALTFATTLTPVPAGAQQPARGYYRAELAQPASEPRAIAGDLVWACEGKACVAGKGTSRPLRICREVNRKFGPVESFTAKGEALSAEELAKCNS